MDSKKVGLFFIIIGILAISSFLVYPFLREKTESAVPVLKSISEENAALDNSEIWEDTADKPAAEISLPDDDLQQEKASTVVFPIDINAAGVEELKQLNNIGKTIAENIVSYRENFGYFHSVEELMNVEGIGDKRFDNIKDYVYIGEEFLSEATADVQETNPTAVSSSAPVATVQTSS